MDVTAPALLGDVGQTGQSTYKTVNFKCNYGIACFYPGFSGNTLNLTGPIKKNKSLSSMLTWRPLAIFYSAGPRLDVTGTEITRGHFLDPVHGGVSDRCPLAWPLLESNCCGRGTLAAVRWAELLGYFPGESCRAQPAAGEPGIYGASSRKLRVTCVMVQGRI